MNRRGSHIIDYLNFRHIYSDNVTKTPKQICPPFDNSFTRILPTYKIPHFLHLYGDGFAKFNDYSIFSSEWDLVCT